MKQLKAIALALAVVLGTFSATAQTKKVKAKESKIEWIGKKITGQHNGTIDIKDGALVFKGNKLSGGTFTVDMTTINTTDLAAGKGKEKLDGHLKAEDFFGVEKFPTSTLVFKTITAKADGSYQVTADLTIKNITQPVTFDMVVSKNSATAKVIVDRTKYDIKYGSKSFFEGIGDKAIYDDFELNVALKF